MLRTQSYLQYDVVLFIRMNKILIHQNEGMFFFFFFFLGEKK